MNYSLAVDICVYGLIILAFVLAIILPYPDFGSSKNKKDESNNKA